MKIQIVTIGRRPTARKHAPAEDLLSHYCQRISRFAACELKNYPSEERFISAIRPKVEHGRRGVSGRGPNSKLLLLDFRGRNFSTEKFADWLRGEREHGVDTYIFAIGPADGWSEDARGKAGMLLSLGPMTLPHELATVVLAEQIYRVFTIMEGHPYHLGHSG